MLGPGARQRQRAQVEGDIVALERRATGCRQVIDDVKKAREQAGQVDRDLAMQGEIAEITLAAIEEQLDDQYAYLKALPKQREPRYEMRGDVKAEIEALADRAINETREQHHG